MQLNEMLQISLLALASRHPESRVDVNTAILDLQGSPAEGWAVSEMLELLQSKAPHLLRKKARLLMDAQRSEIYLLEQSEEIPAFWIHCRERIEIR